MGKIKSMNIGHNSQTTFTESTSSGFTLSKVVAKNMITIESPSYIASPEDKNIVSINDEDKTRVSTSNEEIIDKNKQLIILDSFVLIISSIYFYFCYLVYLSSYYTGLFLGASGLIIIVLVVGKQLKDRIDYYNH